MFKDQQVGQRAGSYALRYQRVAAIPNSVLTLGANIAGTSDVLVLAVQNLTAAVESYYGSINFRELL